MGSVIAADDADDETPAWMSGLSGQVQRRLLRFGIRTPDELLAFPWAGPQWTGFFGEDGMREIEAISTKLRAQPDDDDHDDVPDGELDRELAAAVHACVDDETARVVLAWLGLYVAASPTYEQVASRTGSTRERVRDDVERARTLARAPGLQLRVLAGLVDGLSRVGIATVREAQASMHAAGLTSASLSIAGALRAARFFAIDHALELDDDPAGALVGEPDKIAAVGGMRRRLTRMLGQRGCLPVDALVDPTSGLDEATLVSVLEADPRIRWLDPDHAWLWMPELGTAVLRPIIDRVLAVTGALDIDELHAALLREPTLTGMVPPPAVLRSLLAQLGEHELDGASVRDRRPPNPELAATMTVGELAMLAGIELEELVARALDPDA